VPPLRVHRCLVSTIRIMGIMELGVMILMVFVATSYYTTLKAHGITMGIMEPNRTDTGPDPEKGSGRSGPVAETARRVLHNGS
jgi:hypothetical protein